MDYEELLKEAFKFKKLDIGRRVRKFLGRSIPAKTIARTQSPEGRMFDRMMAEFVAANPRLAKKSYGGASKSITRARLLSQPG